MRGMHHDGTTDTTKAMVAKIWNRRWTQMNANDFICVYPRSSAVPNGFSTCLSLALLASLAVAFSAGCAPQSAREVIVYTSLDEEFSKPIFAEFTRETGIEVRGKFDVESTK